MNITIYITTKKILPYINNGLKEYKKRLSRFAKVKIKKVKKIKRVDSNSYNIKISKSGKLISSQNLAKKLRTLAIKGDSNVSFYITDDKLITDESVAISKMNISDQLSLVILSEQIYRAFTIVNNMPYHK